MRFPIVIAAVTVALGTFFFGCGDDGGGPANPGSGTCADPLVDLTGTWEVIEMVDATACGEGTYERSYSVQATQDGKNLTVVTSVGSFSGTVCDTTVKWRGKYPDDGGTTTINSLTLTATADGQFMMGVSSWTWSDGVIRCSGTAQISATKL